MNRPSCTEDHQAKIVYFLGGTGRDLGSQNCKIPGGNWRLVVGSLAVETVQFPRGTDS